MARMYMSGHACSKCKQTLKITRLTHNYWCETCRELISKQNTNKYEVRQNANWISD